MKNRKVHILMCGVLGLFGASLLLISKGVSAEISSSRIVYLLTSLDNVECSGNQQYDQYIVEADYPSGDNESFLTWLNPRVGSPPVLGGAKNCPTVPAPYNPVLSPDRTKIAYSRAGFPYVYNTVTQLETGRVPYTPPGGNPRDVPCSEPQWSPDGNYLSCISNVFVSGHGNKPGVYLWNAGTLASVSATPFPDLPQGVKKSAWTADSSGILISGINSSSSGTEFMCPVSSGGSYDPTGLYKYSFSTQQLTTILPPTCDSDWLNINLLSVSPQGKVAFAGEDITTGPNGIISDGTLLVELNVDGTGLRRIPVELWQMSPPNGFCGESVGSITWETTGNALIAGIYGPDNDLTSCDTNEPFYHRLERVDAVSGDRTIVVNRIAEGYGVLSASSAEPFDSAPPEISNLTINPNPKGVTSTATLSADAIDDSGIQRVEYYLDTDPGQGNGTEMTFVSGTQYSAEIGTSLSASTYQVYIRALDINGNWSEPISNQLVVVNELSSLEPAQLWVGLGNSDAVGIRFDLMVEAYLDGQIVSSGQIDSVHGGSSGFNNANLNVVPFDGFDAVPVGDGDSLEFKAYVRNACVGSGKNSGLARLWYNDDDANTHFGASIDESSSDYYLLDDFILYTSVGGGPRKNITVQAGAKCSPFKLFGTWTTTL